MTTPRDTNRLKSQTLFYWQERHTSTARKDDNVDETRHPSRPGQTNRIETGKTKRSKVISQEEQTPVMEQTKTSPKNNPDEKEPPKYYLMYPKIRLPSSLAKYADRYMCSGCDFFMDSRKQFRRHEKLFRKCQKVNDKKRWDAYESRPITAKRVVESEPESENEEKEQPLKRIKKLPRQYYWNGSERDPLNLNELIKNDVSVRNKTNK